MKHYRITWTIEVDAEDAHDAARTALEIQLDPDSLARIFEVTNLSTNLTESIDLLTEDI